MRSEKYRLGDTRRGAINKSRSRARVSIRSHQKLCIIFSRRDLTALSYFTVRRTCRTGWTSLLDARDKFFPQDWPLSDLTAFEHSPLEYFYARSSNKRGQNFAVRSEFTENALAAGIFTIISNRPGISKIKINKFNRQNGTASAAKIDVFRERYFTSALRGTCVHTYARACGVVKSTRVFQRTSPCVSRLGTHRGTVVAPVIVAPAHTCSFVTLFAGHVFARQSTRVRVADALPALSSRLGCNKFGRARAYAPAAENPTTR